MAAKRPLQNASLAESHPNLASQAVGWDPAEYSRGSDRKMPWQCPYGHRWEASISSRVGGNGCPFCSGHKVLIGFNDLSTTDPELAAEADGWDPRTVVRGSHKKLGWICYFGHKWSAEVKSRALIGAGCPYCDGKLAIVGVNDLQTLFPDIAKTAYEWDPSQVKATSHKKLAFKCDQGHVYVQAVRRRVEAKGCPICQNHQVLTGFNDLATTHPQIANEAYGWNPQLVVAGTPAKKSWKCSEGHTWVVGVYSRAIRGTSCPYCSGRHAIVGKTDLLSTHPETAGELVGDDPKTIKAGTNRHLTWKCKQGHQWTAKPSSRTAFNTGCPFCSGKRVTKGVNDLATTHPELAAQAVDWDPTEYSRGSDKKVCWRCQHGHEWAAVISSRVSGIGCPICSGKRVLKGFNDLATSHPALASEADGWDPTTVGFGSGKVVSWLCESGHQYKSRISQRTYMKTGCPQCAPTGFDQSQPAWIYLIENSQLKMLQIGITNNPENRLAKHKRSDWFLIDLRGPIDGYLAQQLETSSLHALVGRGAVLGHRAGVHKFDGYTEAWLKASLEVESIRQILNWVYEDDGSRAP
jgi:hypothetical protein